MEENVEQKTSPSFDRGKLSVAILATAYFLYYAQTAKDWHFIDNFNLIIHEAGHTLFFFLGEFAQITAGSLFQILFPLVFVIYFYFKGSRFSSALLLFWVGQNIINVSIYLSDAMAMQLPLLGGDSSIHDWNYILSSMGILRYTDIFGSCLFGLGILVILTAFCCSIFQSKNNMKF